jgi:hypothetical protein
MFLNEARELGKILCDLAKEMNYHADIVFQVVDTQKNNNPFSPNHLFLVPAIPVDIGELHYVIPVGKFLKKLFSNIRKHIPEKLMKHLYSPALLNQMFLHQPKREKIVYDFSEFSKGDRHGLTFFESLDFGWTFVDDHPANYLDKNGIYDYLTLEPHFHGEPFGYSLSGAVAAAEAIWKLYPGKGNQTYKMRGRTIDSSGQNELKVFKENTNATSFIEIKRNNAGTWEILSPVFLSE